MTEELKPCRFSICKRSEPFIDEFEWMGDISFHVTCRGCGASGPVCESSDEAAEAWNNRPNAQDDAAMEQESETPMTRLEDVDPEFREKLSSIEIRHDLKSDSAGEQESTQTTDS